MKSVSLTFRRLSDLRLTIGQLSDPAVVLADRVTVVGFKAEGRHGGGVDGAAVSAPGRVRGPAAVGSLCHQQAALQSFVPCAPGIVLQLMESDRAVVPVIVVVLSDPWRLLQQIPLGLGDFGVGDRFSD